MAFSKHQKISLSQQVHLAKNFSYLRLLFSAIGNYTDRFAMVYSAALAFFSLFAIGPLLFIVLLIGSLVTDFSTLKDQVLLYLNQYVGPKAIPFFEQILERFTMEEPGFSLSFFISLIFVFISAQTLFNTLHIILNDIFEIPTKNQHLLKTILKRRLTATLWSLSLGFGLLALLILTSLYGFLLEFLPTHWTTYWPFGLVSQRLIPAAIVFFSLVILFAYFTKFRPHLFSVVMGAISTSIFLFVTKFVLSILLKNSNNMDTVYSISGSVIVVMLWIFLSAQGLLFGAHLTKVFEDELQKNLQ